MSQATGSGSDNAFTQHFAQMVDFGNNWARQCADYLGEIAKDKAPPKAQNDSLEMRALQARYVAEHNRLWQSMLAGDGEGFSVAPEAGDRRFAAPEWRESLVHQYYYQSYLLNSRFLNEMVELLPANDSKLKNRLRFLTRQMIDTLSPANFAATNPEIIKLAIATGGASITDGINNLIKDYEKGHISMTDESAFELGRNVATTAGSVVFENEVMQLIQYAPLTATVNKRPMVVVPPCINKFYILDLQPDNSFIRYMVEQGNTVFLVSWRNAGKEQQHLTWDDYVEYGPITALKVAKTISRSAEVNALGFCVGGTILSTALAVMKARGEDYVTSLTLLTTLLDFSDTGEIGILIDAEGIAERDKTIGKGGLLPARDLQNTFSFLRPNDLVWNYVVNNYMKGKQPAAFDLLYWNSDSTNLPGPFACWYMRHTYLDNSLRVPGKLNVCGEKLDLGLLDMPVYFFAAREDHIVPWRSAYLGTGLLSGAPRFVLGASGHIAGVINPASKNKRSYWVNDNYATAPDAWLAEAEEKPGSWWRDWSSWFSTFAGGVRAAPKKPGNTKYLPIEPAPGRYVRQRAD